MANEQGREHRSVMHGISPEKVAPYCDGDIENFVRDPLVSELFRRSSPVLWLKGCIAVNNGMLPSEVTDEELAVRFVGGGYEEWDPVVMEATAIHLHSVGIDVVCRI